MSSFRQKRLHYDEADMFNRVTDRHSRVYTLRQISWLPCPALPTSPLLIPLAPEDVPPNTTSSPMEQSANEHYFYTEETKLVDIMVTLVHKYLNR